MQNPGFVGKIEQLGARFVLVGSIPEGTRIGLASEIDMLVEFDAFKEHPFHVTLEDPFHIRANPHVPQCIKEYLDDDYCFDFDKFMAAYLETIESVLEDVFAWGRNPTRLSTITTNKEFVAIPCEICSKGAAVRGQCAKCAVAVSRTKIGACLQFEWNSGGVSAYCSMDVVPKFNTESMPAMKLACAINTGIASLRNSTIWQNHLRSYVEADMIVHDLDDPSDPAAIEAVILKEIIVAGESQG